ncbi:hypothetical protein NDU88_004285 [Pleurodeles waltl]|uniref:Uncharacterized protein n=1 Tax=Pleurodeles waltl TaxID=8319 RepID=A0AAV7VIA5_PLEWA|nr:hypothetical protein NDU88_004285 [Pleurodeles waltl]
MLGWTSTRRGRSSSCCASQRWLCVSALPFLLADLSHFAHRVREPWSHPEGDDLGAINHGNPVEAAAVCKALSNVWIALTWKQSVFRRAWMAPG